MVSVKDLQDVVDDLKGQAGKRASELFGDSKSEVRRAIGGHSDGTLLGVLGLGLVLGAIVGAAIALLFTPFSGDETRRRLGESVDKVRSSDEMKAGNGSTRPVSAVGTPPYVSS
jgi:YtxH-like protein